MGSYGGLAGMLSVWFDDDLDEWQYGFATCMLGVQHIWWAIHVLDIITMLLLLSSIIAWLIEGSKPHTGSGKTSAFVGKTPDGKQVNKNVR